VWEKGCNDRCRRHHGACPPALLHAPHEQTVDDRQLKGRLDRWSVIFSATIRLWRSDHDVGGHQAGNSVSPPVGTTSRFLAGLLHLRPARPLPGSRMVRKLERVARTCVAGVHGIQVPPWRSCAAGSVPRFARGGHRMQDAVGPNATGVGYRPGICRRSGSRSVVEVQQSAETLPSLHFSALNFRMPPQNRRYWVAGTVYGTDDRSAIGETACPPCRFSLRPWPASSPGILTAGACDQTHHAQRDAGVAHPSDSTGRHGSKPGTESDGL
jgi:hypothetical protein